MYNLRVCGNMTFPHYLSHTNATKRTLRKHIGVERVGVQTIDKWQDYQVGDNGIYKIIVNPARSLTVGDTFESLYMGGVSYTVVESLELRPAKGNRSFVDFVPHVQTVSVRVNELGGGKKDYFVKPS